MRKKLNLLHKVMLVIGGLASSGVLFVADAAPISQNEPISVVEASAIGLNNESIEGSENKNETILPTQVGSQVPGYYRMRLGEFEITALFDGTFDFHPELLKNMDQNQINQILLHHYGKNTNIQT